MTNDKSSVRIGGSGHVLEDFAVRGEGGEFAGVLGEDEAVGAGGFEIIRDGRRYENFGGFGEGIGGRAQEVGAEGGVGEFFAPFADLASVVGFVGELFPAVFVELGVGVVVLELVELDLGADGLKLAADIGSARVAESGRGGLGAGGADFGGNGAVAREREAEGSEDDRHDEEEDGLLHDG